MLKNRANIFLNKEMLLLPHHFVIFFRLDIRRRKSLRIRLLNSWNKDIDLRTFYLVLRFEILTESDWLTFVLSVTSRRTRKLFSRVSIEWHLDTLDYFGSESTILFNSDSQQQRIMYQINVSTKIIIKLRSSLTTLATILWNPNKYLINPAYNLHTMFLLRGYLSLIS